jgi:hypothetical protein
LSHRCCWAGCSPETQKTDRIDRPAMHEHQMTIRGQTSTIRPHRYKAAEGMPGDTKDDQ